MPFAFLAWIGINGRTAESDWQFVEYGPRVARDVLAYGTAIRVAEQAILRPRRRRGRAVREAAATWVSLSDRGFLKDILPAHLGDNSETGPKAEIAVTQRRLIWYLERYQDEALKANNMDAFVDLVCLELRVSDINKYADFEAISRLSGSQTNTLNRLQRIEHRLEPKHREQIAANLESLREPDNYVSRLLYTTETLILRSGRTWIATNERRRMLVLATEQPLEYAELTVSEWTDSFPIETKETFIGVRAQIAIRQSLRWVATKEKWDQRLAAGSHSPLPEPKTQSVSR